MNNLNLTCGTFALGDFALDGGAVLLGAVLAYETYGTLAPDGRNGVVLGHGYTSSQHAAGLHPGDAEPGWWDGVIGPGRAIDTGRFFVVCSNMLGSSFGSTGPKSVDPRTGKPYGPNFPALTIADIVRAQKHLADGLGIKHVVLAAGLSFGGFQALQWGEAYPDFVTGVAVVCSAPRGIAGQSEAVRQILERDPNWHGGRHYDKPGAMAETLRAMRVETMRRYGYAEILADRGLDEAGVTAAIDAAARAWASVFDGNSMLVLGDTQERVALDSDFAKLRGKKLLYVLCASDRLFPQSLAPGVMAQLQAVGVEAAYFPLRSRHGHAASGSEPEKWAPALADLIRNLS
ncbi:MAG TPA: alpha/beta fold hydrolase [Stellaceae bacterium]|nr:alpha/beta fold hydrolase [Stellaceae bacterium]